MTIDRHNIEAYLLDYYEGRMDPVLSAELMAFLAENPEYDFVLPESGTLISGGDHFDDAAGLKKDFRDIVEINDANFEEFCIASAEGLLARTDILRLETWLEQHPDRQTVYLLYQRLKLQPDKVVFPEKSMLKRGGGQTILFRTAWTLLGLAASVAVFMLLYHPSPAPVPAKMSSVIQPVPENPSAETPALPKEVMYAEITTQRPNTPAFATAAVTAPAGKQENLTPLPMRDARITSAVYSPGVSVRPKTPDRPQTEFQLASSGEAGRESLLPSMVNLLTRKVNLWKAAETAVTGFNYLTESQVAISRTVDEGGRPVALTLDTEQYMIRGNKLK